jgi:prevent-host-death family protein
LERKQKDYRTIAELDSILLMVKSAMTRGWTLTRAKANFEELIDQAKLAGPQVVSRNGRPVAVVVSVNEWKKRTRRKGSLAEFFASSPLRGSGLNIKRLKGGMRKIDL